MKMKLSKNIISIILSLLAVSLLVFGCDTHVTAKGKDWSFEAGASTTAELKK